MKATNTSAAAAGNVNAKDANRETQHGTQGIQGHLETSADNDEFEALSYDERLSVFTNDANDASNEANATAAAAAAAAAELEAQAVAAAGQVRRWAHGEAKDSATGSPHHSHFHSHNASSAYALAQSLVSHDTHAINNNNYSSSANSSPNAPRGAMSHVQKVSSLVSVVAVISCLSILSCFGLSLCLSLHAFFSHTLTAPSLSLSLSPSLSHTGSSLHSLCSTRVSARITPV